MLCGKPQKVASDAMSSAGTPVPSALSPKIAHEAARHLTASCKVMARLVAVHGVCQLAVRENPPFQTLASSIICQQLSARAAGTIKRRVLKLVTQLTPVGILAVPPEDLRAAGLSGAKAAYVTELATRVADGRLDLEALRYRSDEDIVSTLTELPGIGRWTAEMFLIFSLKRPDVLALGDAGLQRAARLLYGEAATLEVVGQDWKPYRSVASWYLWRHLDSNGVT